MPIDAGGIILTTKGTKTTKKLCMLPGTVLIQLLSISAGMLQTSHKDLASRSDWRSVIRPAGFVFFVGSPV